MRRSKHRRMPMKQKDWLKNRYRKQKKKLSDREMKLKKLKKRKIKRKLIG